MRNPSDVTEAELKKVYDNTPAVNQYVPWEEVQENNVFKTLLINQIIAKEEEPAMQKTPSNSVGFLPTFTNKNNSVFEAVLSAHESAEVVVFPSPSPQKIKRRSTITLHERQIEKLKTALCLSRNCLMFGGMSDAVRNEALESLAESQKIIQSFYERACVR